MHYFFLSTALNPLKLGVFPGLAFQSLLALLEDNMDPKDFRKIDTIRTFIDLKNVKRLLQKRALDTRGNLTEEKLKEALQNKGELPSYLYEHLSRFDQIEDQVLHFSKVFVDFFCETTLNQSGFLPFYFSLERECRLLLVGLRSKKIGRDLAKELQYEGVDDPLVAHLLAQKDSPNFDFPPGYRDFGDQVKQAGENPMDQYKVFAHYLFNQVMERVQDHPFSVDHALGYFVLFIFVQDWDQLRVKQEEGGQLLDEIVEKLG